MRKEKMVGDIVSCLRDRGVKTRGLKPLIMSAFPAGSYLLYSLWSDGYKRQHWSFLFAVLEIKGIPLELIPWTQKEEESESTTGVTLLSYDQSVSLFMKCGWWRCPDCGCFSPPTDAIKCYNCDTPRH